MIKRLLAYLAIGLYVLAVGILFSLIHSLQGGDLWSDLANRVPMAVAIILGIVLQAIFYPERTTAAGTDTTKRGAKKGFFLIFDTISAFLLVVPAIYAWGMESGWALVLLLLLAVALTFFFQWARL
ncbi:hypothetical protein [Meiothermus taiwanensis]|jgi:hypothetical protein|uniref:hypothetical protein n=1 Tax=Meiothermus taiwanensis TaxID=172827 RepID=UPI0004883899|nr:hypothetical protein [Meiothermus taiwanensis]KIQ54345.1 hypothetical protein SY28_09115 [Meiothermus taiwanensis]KZK14707.1 hypothetical protein A3962_12850 [Meiothermus taiwanensis]